MMKMNTRLVFLSGLLTLLGLAFYPVESVMGQGRVFSDLGFGAGSEVTISSGAVTRTGTLHSVDTEGDAASDDLDTISGGTVGDLILFYPANGARTVVVKHGTGNILVSGDGDDLTLDDASDLVMGIYDGSNWLVQPYGASPGAGFAPTDGTYLVTSTNGSLSAEVVVSALAGGLTFAGDDSAGRTITLGQQVTNADSVVIDVPLANVTIDGVVPVTVSATQTLTNKTLTAPVISTISNTGTLTLPTSTDTLVGRATTDTLTNKTLTTPVITLEQSSAPVNTTEGRVQWDTDDDQFVIGTGSSTVVISPAGSADTVVFSYTLAVTTTEPLEEKVYWLAQAPVDMTVTAISVRYEDTTATATGDASWTVRKNTTTIASQSADIYDGMAGVSFEDWVSWTGSVSVSAGDDLNVNVSSVGSGTCRYFTITITGTVD